MKYLGLLIVGIISLVFSFMFRQLGQNRQEVFSGQGTITEVFRGDGQTQYYLTVVAEGQTLTGRSVYYAKTNQKYHQGDIVPVTYYHTKNDYVRVMIEDEELVPCRTSAETLAKVTFWAGVLLLVGYGALLVISKR